MKFQLLPEYFKKVGMRVFILSLLISFFDIAKENYHENIPGREVMFGIAFVAAGAVIYINIKQTVSLIAILAITILLTVFQLSEISLLSIRISGMFYVSYFFQFMGILIYALSKDKIFDEYLMALRLESVQLAFYIFCAIIIPIIIFKPGVKMNAASLIRNQVIVFIVIYKIKKKMTLQE